MKCIAGFWYIQFNFLFDLAYQGSLSTFFNILFCYGISYEIKSYILLIISTVWFQSVQLIGFLLATGLALALVELLV